MRGHAFKVIHHTAGREQGGARPLLARPGRRLPSAGLWGRHLTALWSVISLTGPRVRGLGAGDARQRDLNPSPPALFGAGFTQTRDAGRRGGQGAEPGPPGRKAGGGPRRPGPAAPRRPRHTAPPPPPTRAGPTAASRRTPPRGGRGRGGAGELPPRPPAPRPSRASAAAAAAPIEPPAARPRARRPREPLPPPPSRVLPRSLRRRNMAAGRE